MGDELRRVHPQCARNAVQPGDRDGPCARFQSSDRLRRGGRVAPFGHVLKGEPLGFADLANAGAHGRRSEEHTSELQSLMRISYAVFCLKKNKTKDTLCK